MSFFPRTALPLVPSDPRPSAESPYPPPAGPAECSPPSALFAPAPAAATVRLGPLLSLEFVARLRRRSQSWPNPRGLIQPRCGSWWEPSLVRRRLIARAPSAPGTPAPIAPTIEREPGAPERPAGARGAEDESQPSAGDPLLPAGVIAGNAA